MSNPVANLKKHRKAPFPLQGTIGTPGKNIPYRNSTYTDDESRLLEEITGNVAADRLRTFRGDSKLPRLQDSTHSTPRSNGESPECDSDALSTGQSDQDLMSLMMTRLGQLEQRLQFQTKENSEKDKKVRILEDKVRILQKARDADAGDPNKTRELEKKCLLLQQQIHEMETFLAEYGMVWIGEKTDPDSQNYNSRDYDELSRQADDDIDDEDDSLTTGQVLNTLWNPNESIPSDFHVDYNLIKQNIKDLNALAGEGIGQVQHTSDGARLKMPDSIPLTLYANGIIMFSGPFRPFTDQTTQECLQDIMDGYFPSELQDRFPDGVPFDVTDRREVHFKDRLTQVFEGHAQALGGNTKPSRLVPTNLDKNKSTQVMMDHEKRVETSKLPGRQMTMEQFLQRLPSSVIKEGKVVDVRNAVEGRLTGNGGPSGVSVVETDAVKDMKERLESETKSATPRNLTTLRIKNENGDHTYILKMKYTETIKDLKLYIDKQRKKTSSPYDIVSTFPKQVYTDLNKTLQECGLVPNAALHLQPKKTR